jgi:hypothetical protein
LATKACNLLLCRRTVVLGRYLDSYCPLPVRATRPKCNS